MNPIIVSTFVRADRGKVWEHWTEPEHVKGWNFASDDWHCPHAENDLRPGGAFTSRMESKDGSEGFDFTGTYTVIVPFERIEYVMEDPEGESEASGGARARKVQILFEDVDGGTKVTETFDPEDGNSPEFQQAGWQAILDNFKAYVESSI